MRRRSLLTAMAACGASGWLPRSGIAQAAEPLVTADRIVFGQAAALGGPASALGMGMRQGILAAFAEANKAGGVKGRKLELVSKDDGYEPRRSAAATRELIEKDRVFALVGPVGTPTSLAAQPIAADYDVPFVGPFTGAEVFRDAAMRPNVVNVRASYARETEMMVERLTGDLGAAKIAVFYQNDAFGRDGRAGVKQALAKRGLGIAVEGTYERNTSEVAGALAGIQSMKPEAVVLVGTYKPCAEFIRRAKHAGMDVPFVVISFAGSDALAAELGEAGLGVAMTQVVPFPRDASVPVVRRYQGALKAAEPNAAPGFVSLEGYIAGRLAVAALGRLDGAPTREKFMNAINAGGPIDIDGFRLEYGPGDNQGSDSVFLTAMDRDGAFRPVDRLQRN
jgi:ABC-type branched-subunit amino acid transport system substrate-binding protein